MTEPKDKGGFLDGPSLDIDGRLEQRIGGVEPLAPKPEDFAPPVLPSPELEVRDRPKPPKPVMIDDVPRSTWAIKLVVALFVVGIATFVLVLKFRPTIAVPEGVHPSRFVDSFGQAAAGHVLITSSPSGAAVSINGEQLGVTPWAADNRWSGEVKVTLSARGYKVWAGTFAGGSTQTLDVQLKK